MDHRPFENWLLDYQTLTADQKHQLNTHLQGCTSCSALAEVNLALRSVKVAAPAEGFIDRFQIRLDAKKHAMRRRNFWGYSLLTASVLGSLGWFTVPVLSDLVQSPVNMLAEWISSLVSFWASLQAILRAGMVLFKVAPGFVPTYIWAVLLIAAGGWSLVWIFSFMKFTKKLQGV